MNYDEQAEQLEREKALKEKVNTENIPLENEKVETRGRKKKVVDIELEQFQEKFTKVQAGMSHFVSFGLDFLAERMPKKIPVTDVEKEFISESVTEVLKKYKPSMIDYFPEMCLVASLAVFTIPRVQKNEKSLVVDLRDGKQKLSIVNDNDLLNKAGS